jgi:predicted ester cyclase
MYSTLVAWTTFSTSWITFAGSAAAQRRRTSFGSGWTNEHLAKHIFDTEAAFPNYEIQAEDVLSDGDKVVVRGTFRGVHRGAFAGIEPTGMPVLAGLIIIYRVANGRIVDHWMQFDLFTLMQQLTSAGQSASA